MYVQYLIRDRCTVHEGLKYSEINNLDTEYSAYFHHLFAACQLIYSLFILSVFLVSMLSFDTYFFGKYVFSSLNPLVHVALFSKLLSTVYIDITLIVVLSYICFLIFSLFFSSPVRFLRSTAFLSQ
jgi:hypothetical protein